MRLDQALVQRKLCESRTEAQECINKEAVFVDGILCLKQAKNIEDSQEIIVTERRKWVGRGGEKLDGALYQIFKNKDSIRSFCLNKSVLDVGSSTGGFTDCLLSYGVTSIDAVDIGTSQLHISLKNNPKVFSYENTDIREFSTDKKYQIIVADLSFIPLKQVVENIISFGKKDTAFFLLIKPQFEVGKGNTKKGVVKDTLLVSQVLSSYEVLLKEKGLISMSIFPCNIEGGDGNQEYFLYGEL